MNTDELNIWDKEQISKICKKWICCLLYIFINNN
jgi:hypothetical protein